MREGDTHRITEFLKNGIIEIGIVRFPIDLEIYETICGPEEPMIAAVMTGSVWDFEEHKVSISLDELADKPLIMHRKREKMLLESCRQKGLEPRVFCKCDDVRSALSWANIGLGVAVVSKSAVDLISITQLRYLEIDEPSLKTVPAIIWMRNRYLSTSARRFLEVSHL